MRFTLKDIEQLQASNKIQGFSQKSGKNIPKDKSKNIPAAKKVSKTKAWIELHLVAWCGANSQDLLVEYRFHPERKWRFDWALPELKIAIEYEGIFSEKSRHTSVKGFTGDVDKYNAAQALGWRVFRYTAKNYKQVLTDLNKLI